ncbi:MAG: HPF/RaiA family ribosome-associated protein [Candidatus Paceibacterota bacterium]
MNIRFYFQEINKSGQEELEKHLGGKKLDRLTRLLQHGNLALAKFVLNAKYHKHHNIFAVRLGLEVARKNFEAEELSQNLIEAFDLAFDRLINQLRKLESLKHK